jgi:hypothetical protein
LKHDQGLVPKAGLVELTDDDRAAIFGLLVAGAASSANRRSRFGDAAENARSPKAAPGLQIPAPDRCVSR